MILCNQFDIHCIDNSYRKEHYIACRYLSTRINHQRKQYIVLFETSVIFYNYFWFIIISSSLRISRTLIFVFLQFLLNSINTKTWTITVNLTGANQYFLIICSCLGVVVRFAVCTFFSKDLKHGKDCLKTFWTKCLRNAVRFHCT